MIEKSISSLLPTDIAGREKEREERISSQAEIIRHGITHSLVKFDPELKLTDYITKDIKMKEKVWS